MGNVVNYFVKDNFTDPDSTNLSSHTGETGAAWTVAPYASSVTPIITSNRVRSDPSSTALAYSSGLPPTADYTLEFLMRQVTDVAVNGGATFRMDTANDTYYTIRYNASLDVWELRRTLLSTAIGLGTNYPDVLANGDERTVKVVIIGPNIEVFIDGVSRITATNSDITAAGRVGVRLTAIAAPDVNGLHIDWIQAY